MSKYVQVELCYKGIITIIEKEEIKQGIFFGENDDILTNAGPEIFEAWQAVKDDINFDDFLEENNFNFELGKWEHVADDRYYSIEEIDELRSTYKYFYNSFNNEYMTIDNFGLYDYDYYFEFYNGNNYEELKIDLLSENIELIESDLNYKDTFKRTGKYELYKIDDVLTLIYNSFYRNSMLEIEKEYITEEELKERFDFELE